MNGVQTNGSVNIRIGFGQLHGGATSINLRADGVHYYVFFATTFNNLGAVVIITTKLNMAVRVNNHNYLKLSIVLCKIRKPSGTSGINTPAICTSIGTILLAPSAPIKVSPSGKRATKYKIMPRPMAPSNTPNTNPKRRLMLEINGSLVTIKISTLGKFPPQPVKLVIHSAPTS